MGSRRDAFAPEEWYHCYNRGIDKRRVFTCAADQERFLQALYLSNDIDRTNRYNIKHLPYAEMFRLSRGAPLVEIGSYCLMPNHFHILLKELTEGGVSKFMHKVGTSYTMYFNIKNERSGNLFVKPFRSRHVADDRYFRHIAQYIHLNSAELFEKNWKKGKHGPLRSLEARMLRYRFSSFTDYFGPLRPERSILNAEVMELLKDGMPAAGSILDNAAAYYAQLSY